MSYGNLLPDFVRNPNPDLYTRGTPLFLDFETTNLDKGSALSDGNRLVLSCWQSGWAGRTHHSWGSEFEQQELLEAVRSADFMVAHNAKFELQWLQRCGADLSKIVVYDTMLAEYVIGGNRWQTQHLSLENCLRRNGLPGKVSVVSKMIKAGICPSEIPKAWLLNYCERDVSALPQLMRSQLAKTSTTRLLPVIYSRCLLTPVLADLERNGMQLDANLVRTKFDETTKELRGLEIEMNHLTGGAPLVAGKQLAELVYEKLGFPELMVKKGREWVPKRTPGNKPKTDGDTIAALKPKTKEQIRFKELYERLNDAKQTLAKYLDKWVACVTENNGHLAGAFNQTNTATHRTSSSGRKYKTQMQNLPRSYKGLFCAPEGYVIGEADGAQLEFRVAAHQGRDGVALGDIRDGVDVHTNTANVLTAAGQPTTRQEAKSRTFRPLYGGSSGTDAEKEYNQFFKRRYKGIADAQQGWIGEVLRTGSLETEWGLRYYWPDTVAERSGYVRNSTAISNYPVQALATAEIIPLCLVAMWHVFAANGWPITIINTVHDSIVAQIKIGYEDKFTETARWALTEFAYEVMSKLYGIELECQLGCEVKVGPHWGDGKGEKFESSRNG